MTPGARLAAAAEILTEIFARRAAADRVLAAWGKAHRFAGSKDRAAIAERVYTVLRRRNECAFRMQDELPRALVIGSLAVADGLDVDAIAALCTDGAHALGALTSRELAGIADARRSDDLWVRHNYPRWLHGTLDAQFGGDLPWEMEALNARAPLDVRVNALKATRDDVMREFSAASIMAEALRNAPLGIRIPVGADKKLTALAGYTEGRFEIQDEASQRAARIANAQPGQLVVDLAAGGGGKSLALAVDMQNQGRILACDIDPARLQRLQPRAQRAGATIIEETGDPYGERLTREINGAADVVFVDAPCSGSGTWRRNPESKWTLDEARLAGYRAAQRQLVERAAALLKPSGVLVYAVCSIFTEEHLAPLGLDDWGAESQEFLTPGRNNTDGFFVARLRRREMLAPKLLHS